MGSDSDGISEGSGFESELNDSICESYHSSDEEPDLMEVDQVGQNK